MLSGKEETVDRLLFVAFLPLFGSDGGKNCEKEYFDESK